MALRFPYEVDPLREFIRNVQSYLAPPEDGKPLRFTPRRPVRPYLIFELLDRDTKRETERIFRPYLYYTQSEGVGREPLKDRELLTANAKRLLRRDIPLDDPKELVHRYEKWEIPVGYKASGLIWEAWKNGKLLDSRVDRFLDGLFFEFRGDDLGGVLKELARRFKEDYTESPPPPDDDLYDWIEFSLVHQLKLDELAGSKLVLVHYPLIIRGLWFVGFAYFLAQCPDSPRSIFSKGHYSRALGELTKQHPSLMEFLKRRALDGVDDETWAKEDAPAIYRRVVERYFGCFDLGGLPDDPLVKLHDVGIYLPLHSRSGKPNTAWVRAGNTRRREWTEFIEPLLEELWSAVQGMKKHRERILSRQQEETSRQMLLEVSHSIDTDLASALGKLENAALLLDGVQAREGLGKPIRYIENAKTHIRRTQEHAQAILAIEKRMWGKSALPLGSFQLPNDIIEDLETLARDRSLLRLSGHNARAVSEFLEKSEDKVSGWVQSPGKFTLVTYEILRVGLREILRNALRHIRPDIQNAPLRINLEKIANGALISVGNNRPADEETCRSANSETQQPSGGQFGIGLYKLIFKTCGAQWRMEVKNGWTTVTVRLPEVCGEEAEDYSRGRPSG